MRQYVRNILIYLVALLCIIAFIALFSNSLEIFDEVKGTWNIYKVNAYLGYKTTTSGVIYKGATGPIFGYIIPLLIGIVLIVESFKKSWSGYLKVMNTVFAVILFFCVLFVLLTKEIFLDTNSLGQTPIIRNGVGPRLCAASVAIGAIILLFATWFPWKADLHFIDRENENN